MSALLYTPPNVSRTSEVWNSDAKKPSRGKLAAELGVAAARQDFEARFHAVVAAPGDQRGDFALLPVAQARRSC